MGEKQVHLGEEEFSEKANISSYMEHDEKNNKTVSHQLQLEWLRERILNELDCPLKATAHNLVLAKAIRTRR